MAAKKTANPVVTTMKNNRKVVVIDNGWIMAGDYRLDTTLGRIYLTNCVWVFSWSSIGFHNVIVDPSNTNVTLHRFADVEIPSRSEIYAVPVVDDWGVSACA